MSAPISSPEWRALFQPRFRSWAIRPPGVQRLFLGTVAYFIGPDEFVTIIAYTDQYQNLQPNKLLTA
jgi:hypothetical protein